MKENSGNRKATPLLGLGLMLGLVLPGVSAPAQSPPAANNLAEAEATPLPISSNITSSAVLQGFSKGRDAAASSKSSAALGLVKAQQEMDGATREAEAKLREAQNTRNLAGASALTQRQQDAASAASQQAAGGIGNVLGESLAQSIQQGAQAAGQAVGGAAAGHAGSMAGPGTGGGAGEVAGGGAAAGASAAAGQIFGGSSAPSAPAASDGAGQVGGGEPPATMAAPTTASAEANALRTSGKRYIGPSRARPLAPDEVNRGDDRARPLRPDLVNRGDARARPLALFDAVCPRHGKYGGKVGKVKGCPQCAAERLVMWDAVCSIHGKYGGQGPRTGCPECRIKSSSGGGPNIARPEPMAIK